MSRQLQIGDRVEIRRGTGLSHEGSRGTVEAIGSSDEDETMYVVNLEDKCLLRYLSSELISLSARSSSNLFDTGSSSTTGDTSWVFDFPTSVPVEEDELEPQIREMKRKRRYGDLWNDFEAEELVSYGELKAKRGAILLDRGDKENAKDDLLDAANLLVMAVKRMEDK